MTVINNILCSKCNASYQTFYLAGNSVMCQCLTWHFASLNTLLFDLAMPKTNLDGGKTSNKVVKKTQELFLTQSIM